MGGRAVVAAWLLTLAIAQTPELQNGLDAQLTFERGLQARSTADEAARAAETLRYAALKFEALEPYNSPAIERTAGNAHFLAGDLPRAILAYRRGLRLDPADA